MKTSEADILIVPGWSSSGPDHWQSRWEKNLKTARRVEQADWFRPDRDQWVARIVEAAAESVRPVVLVGHSLGAMAIAHAGPRLAKLPAPPLGAFLVAPADVDNAGGWPITQGETFAAGPETGFAPAPSTRLPFPSLMVASSNDPYCSLAARPRAGNFVGISTGGKRRPRPHQRGERSWAVARWANGLWHVHAAARLGPLRTNAFRRPVKDRAPERRMEFNCLRVR